MFRIQDSLLQDVLHFCSLQDEFVFLDTSLPDHENSVSLLFVKPHSRLVCRQGDNLEEYLDRLQQQLASGNYLAGWVGYEFGALLEGRDIGAGGVSGKVPVVLAEFGVFFKPHKFDHHTGVNNFPLQGKGNVPHVAPSFSIHNLRPNMQQREFIEAIHQVKEFIAAGDTYQVNYTMKLLFELQGSIEDLYQSLRRNQSVGYGAYVKNGEEHILSFSPELFFRKSSHDIIVRPMKGTAVRGRHFGEEQRYKTRLHNDPKNRAENVMIVDLLRNDVSRLLYGEHEATVETESLFDVESYESLLQMTSTVRGYTSGNGIKNLSLSRLFHSLFPCGSITGAPKIRTMQIIENLEKEPRGVYTGAIGYLSPGGDAVFNVPIRTICLRGSEGEMGIGAGITHDSVPIEEWHESLLKGKFLTHLQQPFQLFETLLWRQDSGFYLFDEHLARIERGATFFKFSLVVEDMRKCLQKAAADFSATCMRVRLVLEKDGRIDISATPCEAPLFVTLPEVSEVELRPLCGTVGFAAEEKVDPGPYLFHKTSNRAVYDRGYQKAVERGELDRLFCNSKGEITEGCISNIVVLKNDVYSTPPVSCGLLPGVMREQLLSVPGNSPVPVERILFREDVEEADAVFICNSVRGVVRVKVQTSS